LSWKTQQGLESFVDTESYIVFVRAFLVYRNLDTDIGQTFSIVPVVFSSSVAKMMEEDRNGVLGPAAALDPAKRLRARLIQSEASEITQKIR
jgi:hypothetical protein